MTFVASLVEEMTSQIGHNSSGDSTRLVSESGNISDQTAELLLLQLDLLDGFAFDDIFSIRADDVIPEAVGGGALPYFSSCSSHGMSAYSPVAAVLDVVSSVGVSNLGN